MRAALLRRARERQDGFTLVELLIGIILMTIFGVALYGFLFSSMTASQTGQSQAVTQQQARDALTRMANDVRQAASPDAAKRALDSYSPTGFTVYVDNRRTVDPRNPVDIRPQLVRYSIVGGKLQREVANPIGSVPPFSYTAYSAPEVMVEKVNQGAVPLFSAFTKGGAALPASASAGTVGNAGPVATVRLRLLITYMNGNTNPTAEFSTDVAPRNPLSYR